MVNKAIEKLRADIEPSRVTLTEEMEACLQSWENGHMLRRHAEGGGKAADSSSSAAVASPAPTTRLRSKTRPAATAAQASQEAQPAAEELAQTRRAATPAAQAEVASPGPGSCPAEPASRRSLAEKMRNAKRRCA